MNCNESNSEGVQKMDNTEKNFRSDDGMQKKDGSHFQAESWEAAHNLDHPRPFLVDAPPYRYSPYAPPPPPLPHHRGHLGLHSLLAETLEELSATFQDVHTIEAVVQELDEDALPICKRISGEGITHPRAFLDRFFELEAAERLRVRQLLLADVTQNTALVLFPLPPYVTYLLRPVLARELSFNTTEHVPVHIQREDIQPLDYDQYRQLLNTTNTIHSLVLDGQGFKKILTIRSNAAGVLELLLKKSLKTVYLHKVPHLPRGERFVSLDLSQYPVEIHAI
jgi:hypothetical protein